LRTQKAIYETLAVFHKKFRVCCEVRRTEKNTLLDFANFFAKKKEKNSFGFCFRNTVANLLRRGWSAVDKPAPRGGETGKYAGNIC